MPDTPVLPDFPACQGDIPVSAKSAAFRRATRDDLTFLRELYRSFRIDEFASLGWSAEQLRAFLDHQFDLQHRCYVTTFPQADFLLILDHDDFESNRSKIMNVIDSDIVERDAGGKPHHTFPHSALRENTPAGRLYLDASHEDWRIIDIGLTAERRSAGLGSAVMRAVKRHAQASAAAAVVLHVACENHGAQQFYRRLGFREVAREQQTYARMEWKPGSDAD